MSVSKVAVCQYQKLCLQCSPLPKQKAVQDNRHAREEQVLKEKRAKEKEELARRRGSQKTSSRVMTSTSEEQVDLRGELEVWRSRTIDVSSLERPKRRLETSPEQKDFRHILRQPDHSRKERGREKVEERRREKVEERGRVERGREKVERGRGAKEWREMGRGKKVVRVERPKWSRTADNHSINELDFDSETQF